jgi:hypothetical protein
VDLGGESMFCLPSVKEGKRDFSFIFKKTDEKYCLLHLIRFIIKGNCPKNNNIQNFYIYYNKIKRRNA